MIINGINYEFNNRTVEEYDEDNNNSNENNFNNNQNEEEELINNKNKIETLINNPNNIILERIDFYKNRCINIIGKKVYMKAYECLRIDRQNKNNNKNVDYNVREKLTSILGKNNIGFWQMISQILILEDLLNKNKS